MTHVEVSSFNDVWTMPCYPEICTSTSCRYHPQTSAGGQVASAKSSSTNVDLQSIDRGKPAKLVSTAWLTSGLPSHCSTILVMKMGLRQQLFFDNVNPATRLLEKRRQMSLPETPAWNSLACRFHCQDKIRVGVTHPRYEVQDALENQKAWWLGTLGTSSRRCKSVAGALCEGGRAVSEKRRTAPGEGPWPAPLVGLSPAVIPWDFSLLWMICLSAFDLWRVATLQDLHLQNQLVKFNKFLQDNEVRPPVSDIGKTWGKHQRILLQIPATPASYCISRYFKQFWNISSCIICLEIFISIVRSHANFCDLSESKWAHSWPPGITIKAAEWIPSPKLRPNVGAPRPVLTKKPLGAKGGRLGMPIKGPFRRKGVETGEWETTLWE